jgi:hypothetical protein
MLSQRHADDSIAPAALKTLDRGFRYLNQDFPLIHLNRKSAFTQYFDPSEAPQRCAARPLKVFPSFVLGEEFGKALVPGAMTTPPRQWAYASVIELPAASGFARGSSRLVDVRAGVTVTRGCLGVGVLTPDQQAFVTQTSLRSDASQQVADLLLEPSVGKANWLVISNCSADGESAGIVHGVQMFPVERVTTRSIPAAIPEAVRH